MDTIIEDDLSFLLRRRTELEPKYGNGDGGRFLSADNGVARSAMPLGIRPHQQPNRAVHVVSV